MGIDGFDADTHDGTGPLGSPETETASFDDGASVPGVEFTPLRFDPREFMQFVEDEDLSEEEAITLLRIIWEIMVGFVDLGFGLHPIQHVVDGFPVCSNGSLQRESADVLSSGTLSDTTKTKTAGRHRRRAAAKEDS